MPEGLPKSKGAEQVREALIVKVAKELELQPPEISEFLAYSPRKRKRVVIGILSAWNDLLSNDAEKILLRVPSTQDIDDVWELKRRTILRKDKVLTAALDAGILTPEERDKLNKR